MNEEYMGTICFQAAMRIYVSNTEVPENDWRHHHCMAMFLFSPSSLSGDYVGHLGHPVYLLCTMKARNLILGGVGGGKQNEARENTEEVTG